MPPAPPDGTYLADQGPLDAEAVLAAVCAADGPAVRRAVLGAACPPAGDAADRLARTGRSDGVPGPWLPAVLAAVPAETALELAARDPALRRGAARAWADRRWDDQHRAELAWFMDLEHRWRHHGRADDRGRGRDYALRHHLRRRPELLAAAVEVAAAGGPDARRAGDAVLCTVRYGAGPCVDACRDDAVALFAAAVADRPLRLGPWPAAWWAAAAPLGPTALATLTATEAHRPWALPGVLAACGAPDHGPAPAAPGRPWDDPAEVRRRLAAGDLAAPAGEPEVRALAAALAADPQLALRCGADELVEVLEVLDDDGARAAVVAAASPWEAAELTWSPHPDVRAAASRWLYRWGRGVLGDALAGEGSLELLAAVVGAAAARLGDDAARWAHLYALAPRWTGTVDEALDVVDAVWAP